MKKLPRGHGLSPQLCDSISVSRNGLDSSTLKSCRSVSNLKIVDLRERADCILSAKQSYK